MKTIKYVRHTNKKSKQSAGENIMISLKRIKQAKLKRNAILAGSLFSVMFASNYSMAQAEKASYLEEIVVTARKVSENLQETPVAVSAFTSEAMDRRMIVGTEDLSRVTPNLQFKSYSPLSGNSSAAQVFIRGIGQSDSSGGIDPGVGLYIDDVYMGRAVGGVMGLKDISNIQVLRGPQGTLFGRNTIGGAVLLTSTAPGDEFGGEAKISVGDDSLYEFFGALDIPMGDALAARISLGKRQRDGYVTRIYDGVDLGNEDSLTFNGSLHGDMSETVNFVLRADYTEEDENGSPFVFAAINENQAFPAAASVDAGCPDAGFPPANPGPPFAGSAVDLRCANDATWNLGKYKNGGNTKAESSLENKGLSLALNWELNESVSLKSITADRSLEWFGSRDADNTYLTILSTQYDSKAEQFSQEFQTLFSGSSYDGVVGLYYFDEKVNDVLKVAFGNPGYLLPPPTREVAMDYQDAKLHNENWALFTQWSLDLTDSLSLSAGVRYTEEEKSVRLLGFTNLAGVPLVDDGTGVFLPASDFPDPVFPAVTDIQPAHPPGTNPQSGYYNVLPQTFSQKFDAVTGSLSLKYAYSDMTMFYMSWSQGFKSGGFNQRFNDLPPSGQPIPTPFDSEEAESYELGFKSDLSDSLRLNAAIFSTDYDDMQLTYRVGIVPVLFNAGKSTIRGAELEFTFAPNEVFILEGSLGYLDDEIKSVSTIPGATAILGTNNDLPFTPKISANVGGAYSFPVGNFMLTPRLDVSYTDEQYFDAANSDEVAQLDPVTVVNASLKLAESADVWSVVLGIENLTDEQYIIAGNSSYSTSAGYAEVIYSRPRNAYLSASYNF